MLIKIVNVAESAKGRTYANDILGRVFFPRTNDMELNKGHYAYAVETIQTKTRDDQGELVDLAVPVKVLQITATFATKAEAIENAAEAGILELEVKAEIAKAAKALNLTDAKVAELADAV